jgi:hypothetical protein
MDLPDKSLAPISICLPQISQIGADGLLAEGLQSRSTDYLR